EIPVSWGIFKLKHVINEFISGGTPNSDNEKFWVQDEEDGIPWVAIGDMTNNEVVMDTKKKITLDGLANKRLRILKSGTLIYSIFASLGKVSLLGIDATTNQAILGLITNEKIDDIFLKYYLKYLEQPIIALSNANTQNNLNSTIVKNIEFSLTNDFNDQKKIASFLDKKTSEIDLTIEKDSRLIELLKEKRTALINHVVTKGLDPMVRMKDSGVEWIGEIPEDWNINRLKFLAAKKAQYGANEEPEYNENKFDYRYVRITDVNDNGGVKKRFICLSQ
ncbi:MAG: restriction endonuclease subunit S, partial [Methanobacterium sp.]